MQKQINKQNSTQSNINALVMKLANKSTVLRLIREGGISRIDISHITGLTRASVTMIVDNLIKEGIVQEAGANRGDRQKRGRTPITLSINPTIYIVGGIYISRSMITVGITNFAGECIVKEEYPISRDSEPYDVMKRVLDKLESMISSRSERLLGVGVAVPGPVDTESGMILNPPNFDKWHDFDMRSLVEERLGTKVIVDDNANAIAIAQHPNNDYKIKDYVSIIVDESGIGAGLVRGGALYRGVGKMVCNLGHTTINVNGERCACGNVGCAEMYAGISNVVKKAKERDHSLTKWQDIVDGADRGDETATSIIRDEANYVASLIVTAINTYGVSTVVLNGSICASKSLIEQVRALVRQRVVSRGEKISLIAGKVCDHIRISSELVIDDWYRGGEI